MVKARAKEPNHFNEVEVELYQELSPITLRQALRPLLQQLRDKNIIYKWRFPFCLTAVFKERSNNVQTPEDIPKFCEQLQIEEVSLLDWRPEFLLTERQGALERSRGLSQQKPPQKKRRIRVYTEGRPLNLLGTVAITWGLIK